MIFSPTVPYLCNYNSILYIIRQLPAKLSSSRRFLWPPNKTKTDWKTKMQNKNEEKSVKAWASVSLLLKYLHQRPSKSKAALVSVWKGEARCCWHMHILWWMDSINDEVSGVASYARFGEKNSLCFLSLPFWWKKLSVKKAFNTPPPPKISLLSSGWLAQLSSTHLN